MQLTYMTYIDFNSVDVFITYILFPLAIHAEIELRTFKDRFTLIQYFSYIFLLRYKNKKMCILFTCIQKQKQNNNKYSTFSLCLLFDFDFAFIHNCWFFKNSLQIFDLIFFLPFPSYPFLTFLECIFSYSISNIHFSLYLINFKEMYFVCPKMRYIDIVLLFLDSNLY